MEHVGLTEQLGVIHIWRPFLGVGGVKEKNDMLSDLGGLASVLDVQSLFFFC